MTDAHKADDDAPALYRTRDNLTAFLYLLARDRYALTEIEAMVERVEGNRVHGLKDWETAAKVDDLSKRVRARPPATGCNPLT